MRYQEIENINFTTIDGQTVQVKNIREMPVYKTLANYTKQKDEMMDEIITKSEFYGNNYESMSYTIFEANKIVIADNDFDFEKVGKIIIPVIN